MLQHARTIRTWRSTTIRSRGTVAGGTVAGTTAGTRSGVWSASPGTPPPKSRRSRTRSGRRTSPTAPSRTVSRWICVVMCWKPTEMCMHHFKNISGQQFDSLLIRICDYQPLSFGFYNLKNKSKTKLGVLSRIYSRCIKFLCTNSLYDSLKFNITIQKKISIKPDAYNSSSLNRWINPFRARNKNSLIRLMVEAG